MSSYESDNENNDLRRNASMNASITLAQELRAEAAYLAAPSKATKNAYNAAKQKANEARRVVHAAYKPTAANASVQNLSRRFNNEKEGGRRRSHRKSHHRKSHRKHKSHRKSHRKCKTHRRRK